MAGSGGVKAMFVRTVLPVSDGTSIALCQRFLLLSGSSNAVWCLVLIVHLWLWLCVSELAAHWCHGAISCSLVHFCGQRKSVRRPSFINRPLP